jgi:hypothetical protein
MILKTFQTYLMISCLYVSTICGFNQSSLAGIDENQQRLILFPINFSSPSQNNRIFEVLIIAPSDRSQIMLSNEVDDTQLGFDQEVQRIRMFAGNSKETEVIFDQNWLYPTEVKSCGFFNAEGTIKKNYVLLAILRKKEDVENNDLVPTQVKASSFLGSRGRLLAAKNLDDALSYLLAQKTDLGENIIYKFKFEYGSTYCQS